MQTVLGEWFACEQLSRPSRREKAGKLECSKNHGGGGSSIVKVAGDVPPARVCFFKPSSLAKGILFANFRPLSLGKGILFGNFGQRNVNLR